MENKLKENLLPKFSNSQTLFAIIKMKSIFIIFTISFMVLVIYQRELLTTNLYLGKYMLSSSTEQQVNVTESSSKNKETSIIRKVDIFVEMKNIQRSLKNIFFIESSCGTEVMKKKLIKSEKFMLRPRQVCAIESTALTNPEHDIYILYTCPLANNFLQHLPDFTTKLINYPNVYIVEVNSAEAFMNTPLQELYESKKLESSNYPVEHFSDLLRLIILWKFGGTYLDLDVVTIKSLLGLGTNFAGIEDWSTINNAVLNVEPFGTGHKLIQIALEFINKNYDGRGWSTNGPQVLTNLILEKCNLTKIDQNIFNCNKFHLLPSKYFYPIHWSREEEFFDGDLGPELVETLKNSSYVVHTWNKLSFKHTVHVGSSQAYGLLANEFCPNVINNCGKEF